MIAARHGFAMSFFAEFIRSWEDIRKKLDIHEIAKEEYGVWKRT